MSPVPHRAVDPAYLRYQYGDTERLHIRAETHRRYSERPDNFLEWVLGHLAPEAGDLVLDVGCGYGAYHPRLGARGARLLGLDRSFAMVAAAHRQAVGGRLPVVTVQGDAEALPVRDGRFHRVLCAHVLFHVPDVTAALRELRRVLRPGGRLVLTTNLPDHLARLYDVHAAAARDLGYTPAPFGSRFHLGHLDVVRSVFPRAERYGRPDAFVFPTVEPALRFYASSRVDALLDRPADGSHRPRLLAAVGERIAAVIARVGVFRVPKGAGCFVATV
jgi:SAM-dependent methyltransferase